MPRASKRRYAGKQLVEELNLVVAQLIKENRQLKRQVQKLSEGVTSAGSNTVDRGLRSIQRRAQEALRSKPTRRRRTRQKSARKTRSAK
jgi:hypothetical protein